MPKGRKGPGTVLGRVTLVSRYCWKPSFFSASQCKQQCPSHISHRGGSVGGLVCTASPWAQRNEPSSQEHPQTLQMAAKEHPNCSFCNCYCQGEVPGWGRLEVLSRTQEGRAGLVRQPNWEIKMNAQYVAHGVWLVKDLYLHPWEGTSFESVFSTEFFVPRAPKETRS